MAARRETESPEVERRLLRLARRRQRRLGFSDLHQASEIAAPLALDQRRDFPERTAPVAIPRGEGADGGQILQRRAREARAPSEIDEIGERIVLRQRLFDARTLPLTEPAHDMVA